MLKILPFPLKVSHKLFVGKHVPNVKKATTALGTALENVFTFADNHVDLVQFLSSDLLHIKNVIPVLLIKGRIVIFKFCNKLFESYL